MRRHTHRGFDLGLTSDYIASEVPEGGLAVARNVVFDRRGRVRQRSAMATLNGSASIPYLEWIEGLDYTDGPSGSVDTTQRIYGLGGAGIYGVSDTSGLGTLLASQSNPVTGRPFKYFGSLILPSRNPYVVAGSPAGAAGATFGAASCSATKGSPVVTVNSTTGVNRGDMIAISRTSAPKQLYIGRVVHVIGGTTMHVFPTPNATIAGADGSALPIRQYADIGVPYLSMSPLCGCAWQNRILMALSGGQSSDGGTPTFQHLNRIVYSVLLGERLPPDAISGTVENSNWSGQDIVGMPGWGYSGYPRFNYIDVTAIEGVINLLSPISQNELLVYSDRECYRISGILTTNRGDLQGSYAIRQDRASSIGCLNEHTMQRTPDGVIVAALQGVYMYRNGNFLPLMSGKVQREWQAFVRDGGGGTSRFFSSAYVQAWNQYQVTVYNNALKSWWCDLNTGVWSTGPDVAGKAVAWASCSRPGKSAQTLAALWQVPFDGASAASITGGSVVRYDTQFDNVQGAASATEPDGTNVDYSITTGLLMEEGEARRRMYLEATIDYIAGDTVLVTVGTGDADGIGPDTIQKSIGATKTLTPTAVSNTTPIQITTPANNLQPGQMVRVSGVTGNTAANGLWKITFINNTTFTLNGSAGNGAAGALGTVSPVKQWFLDLRKLSSAPGIQFNFANNGPGFFELHAISYLTEALELTGPVA